MLWECDLTQQVRLTHGRITMETSVTVFIIQNSSVVLFNSLRALFPWPQPYKPWGAGSQQHWDLSSLPPGFLAGTCPSREGSHAQRPNQPRVPCLPFCACQRSSGAALSERKGTSQAWKTRGLSARLLCSGLEYELQRQTDFLPCLAWAPSQTHGKRTGLLGKQWKPS